MKTISIWSDKLQNNDNTKLLESKTHLKLGPDKKKSHCKPVIREKKCKKSKVNFQGNINWISKTCNESKIESAIHKKLIWKFIILSWQHVTWGGENFQTQSRG